MITFEIIINLKILHQVSNHINEREVKSLMRDRRLTVGTYLPVLPLSAAVEG